MGYYVEFDNPWLLFSLKTLNSRKYISNIGSLISLVSKTKIISFIFKYVIFLKIKTSCNPILQADPYQQLLCNDSKCCYV